MNIFRGDSVFMEDFISLYTISVYTIHIHNITCQRYDKLLARHNKWLPQITMIPLHYWSTFTNQNSIHTHTHTQTDKTLASQDSQSFGALKIKKGFVKTKLSIVSSVNKMENDDIKSIFRQTQYIYMICLGYPSSYLF